MKGRFEMLAAIDVKGRALTLGLRDGCAERCVCVPKGCYNTAFYFPICSTILRLERSFFDPIVDI